MPETCPGMVKKSTFWLAVLAALCVGLFGGLLAAELARRPEDPQVRQPLPPRGESSPAREDPRDEPEYKRLEQAVRSDPQSARAWTELGDWLFEHNLPAEAVRAYESSLVIKPNDPDVLTDMGVMHRRLREYEKAVSLFSKAGEVAPGHLHSRFNKGVVLFYDLRRREEALEAWSELLRLAPDYRTPDGGRLADLLARISGGG